MEVSSSMRRESLMKSDTSSFDHDSGDMIDYVPPDPRKSSIKLDSLMKTDFERFLDEILELYKLAPFKKKTRFLDWLIEKSELSQIDMMWSALQFSCHREFFYLGQLKYPEFKFKKLSFPLKQQFKAVSRERSAYIARKEDALRINQEYFHKPDSYFANEDNENEEDEDDDSRMVEKRGKVASSNLFRKSIEQKTSNRSELKLPRIDSKRSSQSGDLRKGSTPVFAKSNDFEVRSRQFVRTYGLEWNDDQRNLFIRQLIPILDPRHQYFILSLLMSRKYKDFIKLLPKNLALRILANLTSRDLDKAAQVSPVWGHLCRSEDLWRFKIGNVDVSSLMIYSNLADMRKLFDRLDALKNNWKEGKFKIVTLKGHREGFSKSGPHPVRS